MRKRWRNKGRVIQSVRQRPWTQAERYAPIRPKRVSFATSILLGAVFVGLTGGLVWTNWPQKSATSPAPAIEWNVVASVPTRTPDAEDLVWEQRAATADSSVIPASAASFQQAAFGFCHTGGGTNCVVDGDTIWIGGQKVRVADIDAPETHDYRCPEEKALGDRATQRLIQLVNSGPVTLQPIDRVEDVYGRKLRLVMVNGTSVGETLVSEGLARYYEGGRKPWC
ncbi:hypothetical protein GCM10022276_14130 [Sphingomonas limnosediminicola]|uniref:TNase-like domain-containing protein n=1 Tax=Sphingomonas limnosediminicola TaxID=940133 RepID=A0ABP7LB22_9SPHN